jgi:hypothetical protein
MMRFHHFLDCLQEIPRYEPATYFAGVAIVRNYPDWFDHVAKVPAIGAALYVGIHYWPTTLFPDKFLVVERFWIVIFAGACGVAAGFFTQCILEGVYNTWDDARQGKSRTAFWSLVCAVVSLVVVTLNLAHTNGLI